MLFSEISQMPSPDPLPPPRTIEQQPPPWNRVPATSVSSILSPAEICDRACLNQLSDIERSRFYNNPFARIFQMLMPPPQQPSPPVGCLHDLTIFSCFSSHLCQPVPLSCVNGYQLTTLLFGNQCLLEISTNDPSITPDYRINPGYQGVNFQSNVPVTITYRFNCIVYLKYICITGAATNVNKFSYLILDINGKNIGQGVVNRLAAEQCSPRPLPTAEIADKVIITIEETTDGQPPRNVVIDLQGCSVLPVGSNHFIA